MSDYPGETSERNTRRFRRMKFFSAIDATAVEAPGQAPVINANTLGRPVPVQPSELVQTSPLKAYAPLTPSASREESQAERSAFAVSESAPSRRAVLRVAARNGIWRPGTFGFEDDEDDQRFDKRATLSTMVLDGITARQGKPKLVMQSEVSGAASAAGLVGLGNIFGNVLKYGSNYIIQYSFGPGPYGLYTLCLSLVNLIGSIFNLGLDDAMVRFVAIYRAKRQASLLRGVVIFCTAIAGLASISGALLLLFFTPSLVALWVSLRPTLVVNNKDVLAQMTPLLQMMAPLIPLSCLQVVWFAGLRGFKAFKWRVLATNVLQPIMLILLLLAIVHFVHQILGVALALLISTVIGVVVTLVFLLRQLSRVEKVESERFNFREWLTFSTLNFLTTIVDTLLDSTDTILLAVFGVIKVQLGLYGASIRMSSFIALPLVSLNNVFAPTIAELHSKGERQKLEAMFKIVTKWSLVFSIPVFLVVVLFSPFLLALSGPLFVPGWPLVVAFAFGSLVNAGTGTVGSMLLMTGYNKLSFLNSLAAIIVNVVLGIVLTPRYGAMGTAISTGLAICVLNLMRLLQVYMLLKMQPYRWDVLKPIGAGAISALLIGALFYLLDMSHIHTSISIGHAILSMQLLLIPVFLTGYVGLLILFKGSPEDEIVLNSLRKRFLRGRNGKKK